MPRVLAMGGDVAAFTGASEFDVAAKSVGAMIRELEARWPGLGDYVERRMAIAIDGEIFQDADGAAFGEASEGCSDPKRSAGVEGRLGPLRGAKAGGVRPASKPSAGGLPCRSNGLLEGKVMPLRRVALGLALTVLATSAHSAGTATYVNARFGYSVSYPTDLLIHRA